MEVYILVIILCILAAFLLFSVMTRGRARIGSGEEAELINGFTPEEVKLMKELVDDKELIPKVGPVRETRKHHIKHCLEQLYNLIPEMKEGNHVKIAQFGLNLGRAQELLGSIGGIERWWRAVKPLLQEKDYDGIVKLAKNYLEMLGLDEPAPAQKNE